MQIFLKNTLIILLLFTLTTTTLNSKELNENHLDHDHAHINDEMVEIPKDEFKPFFQDLFIKERYLQGAYLHPLKISIFLIFSD